MAEPGFEPGPLAHESDALLTALRGPTGRAIKMKEVQVELFYLKMYPFTNTNRFLQFPCS